MRLLTQRIGDMYLKINVASAYSVTWDFREKKNVFDDRILEHRHLWRKTRASVYFALERHDFLLNILTTVETIWKKKTFSGVQEKRIEHYWWDERSLWTHAFNSLQIIDHKNQIFERSLIVLLLFPNNTSTLPLKKIELPFLVKQIPQHAYETAILKRRVRGVFFCGVRFHAFKYQCSCLEWHRFSL